MPKTELFESICQFRVGSYALQDLNIIKDDFIVGLEEKTFLLMDMSMKNTKNGGKLMLNHNQIVTLQPTNKFFKRGLGNGLTLKIYISK